MLPEACKNCVEPMNPSFEKLTEFFVALGADGIEHTEKGYLAHAVAIYHDLKSWGCDEELCWAGMYHSIYGTEIFQRFALPLDRRAEVLELIGARAERLAYLNCAMVRKTFDQAVEKGTPPFRLKDRFGGQEVEISEIDFQDLCTIHLCDWLEQVPRSKKWNYRKEAYARLAERLGGTAKESFNRVYALQGSGGLGG